MKLQLASLFVLAGLVGGCGESTPPPNDQWAAAQESVGRATATAPAVPDAKLHLQLAQEDLQKSKQLIGSDNRRAATLIALATTEAQLASSLAAAAQAQDDARRAESALPPSAAPPVAATPNAAPAAIPAGASNLQAPNGPPAGGTVPAPNGPPPAGK